MKSTLQTKLNQSVTLTPQLQHAIKLLQLSSIELHQEILQAIENNPFLEINEDYAEIDTHENDQANTAEAAENDIDLDNTVIPKELPLDSDWDDALPTNSIVAKSISPSYNEPQGIVTKSLKEHLLWQASLVRLNEIDAAIAEAIIDSINEDGFLTCSIEDINQNFIGNNDVDLPEIEAVLHLIQSFDPAGVGARNLQECLLLQLYQYPPNTPYLKQAKLIITNHLDAFKHIDQKQLAKLTNLSEIELQHTIKLIRDLHPKPGSLIASNAVEYIIPDLIVKKINNEWIVYFNKDLIPNIKLNDNYMNLLKQNQNSNSNRFVADHLQEARWFLKSLSSRNDTLLTVARCIMKYQEDFLNHGDEAMKALILQDIASALDMHESTISRITTQKYILTPRGVFELKYFFSSHVTTDNGGSCSSTAIRAIIKKLVTNESHQKPLSDNKIAQLLKEQGIPVARRTIAKYREELGIPPYNERKSLT